MIGCKGNRVVQHKPFSVVHELWPWPFDPIITRAHPQFMVRPCVKFHGDWRKGKAVMIQLIFGVINALWPWPSDPKITRLRAHPRFMGNPFVKFHDDRYKGIAIMQHILYSLMHYDLDLWIQLAVCMWRVCSDFALKLYCRYEYTRPYMINRIWILKQLWLQVNGHAWFHLHGLSWPVRNGEGAKNSKWKYMFPAGYEPTPRQSSTGKSAP